MPSRKDAASPPGSRGKELEAWPRIIRDLTRTSVWGTLAVGRPIRLSTLDTGLSPVMAAEHDKKPMAASVTETISGLPSDLSC